MSNYNLSEGLEDHFDFEVTLEGKTHSYSMSYPSTKKLLTIRGFYDRIEAIDKELGEAKDDSEKEKLRKEAEKVAKELADAFTELFTVKGDSMPISDLLDILPSNMRAKFDQMIQKEIGGGEAK